MACAVVVFAACAAQAPPPPDLHASPTKQSLIQGGGVSRPTTPPGADLPDCTYPERVATPAWLPNDLPFPAGTYTTQELGEDGGYHKAVMVLPGTLTAWTRFVLDQWPKSGYILGRGDSEAYEVEDVFTKAPAVGAFTGLLEDAADLRGPEPGAARSAQPVRDAAQPERLAGAVAQAG
jgi:hypothetical protein